MFRDRANSGAMGLDLRRGLAEALLAQAMTQDGDAAGRKTRGEALSEASQLLVGLSAEVRQLRSVRRLQDEIDAARAAAGG